MTWSIIMCLVDLLGTLLFVAACVAGGKEDELTDGEKQ